MPDQRPVSDHQPVSAPQDRVQPSGFDARVRDVAGKLWVWAIIVAILLVLPIVRSITMHDASVVPILGSVPNFQVLDQRGKAFGSNDLKGRVWVGGVVCTACPYYNPEWTDRLFQVQHRSRMLGDSFRIVSFSLDPEIDTPAVLQRWAHDHRTSARMWVFATGDGDQLMRAIIGVMNRSAMAGKPLPDPKRPVFKSSRAPYVALVDRSMRVRGYYDTRRDDEIDRLLHELKVIANEARSGPVSTPRNTLP